MERIDRRSLIAVPASLALLGPAGITRAAVPGPLPLLPLNTNFSFWEHHWIHWLPDHPRYEAIEVALGGMLPAGERLVRLWFTEREGGKRQLYYFNDMQVASTFGQESRFAPMHFSHSGDPGAPQNLSLSFVDKDGVPIVWTVRFAPGQPLSTAGAGLKHQNGHAAHSVLLFWYVDKGALTADAVCSIGGVEHRPKPGGDTQRRVNTAYSSGAYSAVLPYAPSIITPTAQGFHSSWGGREFIRDQFRYTARFKAFHQPASVELLSGSNGALHGYNHAHGDHHFSLALQTPLRPGGEPTDFWFKIDGNRVASGKVMPTAEGLAWEFADPEWAREVGVKTVITATPDGYRTQVSPLH